MIRRILRFLIPILGVAGAIQALAQTPVPLPVQGNLGSISGSGVPYAGIDIQLQNCASPVSITGYFGIIQQEYQVQADPSGVINTTVWPNDDITCNGTTGNSQYMLSLILNGVVQGTPQCYQVVSTQGLWNLNTQQPIACSQQPPNPQDAQFRNLNVVGCFSWDGSPCLTYPIGGGGSASVANIAALRIYAGSATLLNVIGYYSATVTSAPDGGGGVFVDIGAGSTLDDGGVTIYDSVTGHNWKRQFPIQGLVPITWFGAKGDASTDNSIAIQANWNYMCLARAGISFITNGVFYFSSTLVKQCAFIVRGTGKSSSGPTFGSRLVYTGTGSDGIQLNGTGGVYNWNNDYFEDLELAQIPSSPSTWTNAIGIIYGSNFIQGGLKNVQFSNWTGAVWYYHIIPFSGGGSITASISDGTDAAPGHVLCVTAGNGLLNPSRHVTGSGVPTWTLLLQGLTSPQAQFPASCSNGGTAWLVSTSSQVALETMAEGEDSEPYYQSMDWQDVSTSGDGQLIGGDPTAQPRTNVFNILNFNHENAQSTSAGLSQWYADFQGFACVTIKHFVYEGSTTSSPNVFRIGNFGCWNDWSGIYLENGSMTYPLVNLVDTSYGSIYGANLYLHDSQLNTNPGSYLLTGHTFVVEPYSQGNYLHAVNPGGGVSYTEVDPTKTGNNYYDIDGGGLTSGDMNKDFISKTVVENAGFRAYANTGVPQLALLNTAHSQPFLNVHGAWLGGLTAGPVKLSYEAGNVLAAGMVTDASEGRVFEMESNNNSGIQFNVQLAPPTDWVGSQVMIAIRWQLKTTQSGYGFCPLTAAFNQNGSSITPFTLFNASGTGNFGNNGGCAVPYLANNTWQTSYFVGVIPSGSPTGASSAIAISSPAATGTKYLDIAAIYVASGTEVPYLFGGAGSTQPITWPCTAAPTYGTYIVGDACTNSAPTANGIIRWVNTVAGSPGTFSPISTNPTVTCGTTTTCSNTAQTAPRTVWGTVALSSGSPSTAVVTAMTAFTATTSFVCTGNDRTTPATSVSIVNTSTSSITITGPNTVTDSIGYVCVGN